jgi:undecaprenyl diphosphate synthase
VAIGDLLSLPDNCHKNLLKAINHTAKNNRTTLILALSYSSKWEITQAVKTIARQIKSGTLQPEDITEQTIADNLNTASIPDPELMIRTSGEHRISNFLMWQLAYSEFYFTPKLWPDFRKEDLFEAIVQYQQRERRFGKISEQIEEKVKSEK